MTKKSKFEGEVKRAFENTVELFKNGARTVSIYTIAAKLERENDPRWMSRIQQVIPEFVEALIRIGMPVVPVNQFCVRHHADTSVTDPIEALKCVQLRGGGAPAAGIRISRTGDLVQQGHLHSLIELGSGCVRSAIQSAVDAEHVGLIPENGASTLAMRSAAIIRAAAELPPTPVQGLLQADSAS